MSEQTGAEDQSADDGQAGEGAEARQPAEIETADAVQGTVARPTPFAAFTTYAQSRARVESAQVADRLVGNQMDSILTASTEEELDAAMSIDKQTIALKDIDNGAIITIYGFQLATGVREDFQNRMGVYAVMDVTIGRSSDHVVVETGIERIIGWLRMAEHLELFPARRLVVQRQAGAGTMVSLRKIDA